MKLYFDANVLIRAIEGDDDIAAKLRVILDHAEDGGCTIVTSQLSFAETMVGPLKRLKLDPRDQDALLLDELYRGIGERTSGVELTPVDRTVLWKAAELRAGRASLKLPDAIHLATTLITACDAFVSGDQRLLTTARDKVFVCSLEAAELSALNFRLGVA